MYLSALERINVYEETSDSKINFYLACVFNASRALLDTGLAASKSLELLDGDITKKELKPENLELFYMVREFLLKVIPLKGMEIALS
jgi:hypothetical protein